MGDAAGSQAGTSDRSIGKGSDEYVSNYLSPRGIRINQVIRSGEFVLFQKYLGQLSNEALKKTLRDMYLDDDAERIDRLVQFARDYRWTQEKEVQWSTEVCLPGFLEGLKSCRVT